MPSLTVTWEDPLAAYEEGKKLTPIDYLRAIRDGRIPDPPIARRRDRHAASSARYLSMASA